MVISKPSTASWATITSLMERGGDRGHWGEGGGDLESSSLTWRRTSYPASEVRSFRCGRDSLAAAQSHRLLQPQQDKPVGQGWLEICRNVASLPELLVLATRSSFHCLTSLMKWPVFNTHTVINIRSST